MPILDSQWTPPINPDPNAILLEARVDTKSGRHADALAKYQWLFRFSEQIKPNFAAVRSSYVITEWRQLGLVYSPAQSELRAQQNCAMNIFLAGEAGPSVAAFGDWCAINAALGEASETVNMFVFMDTQKPQFAARIFACSMRYLISAKQYALCGKYLDEEKILEYTSMQMQSIRKFRSDARFSPQFQRDVEAHVKNSIATFVALFVCIGRNNAARKIVDRVGTDYDDPDFHSKLDNAQLGIFPCNDLLP